MARKIRSVFNRLFELYIINRIILCDAPHVAVISGNRHMNEVSVLLGTHLKTNDITSFSLPIPIIDNRFAYEALTPLTKEQMNIFDYKPPVPFYTSVMNYCSDIITGQEQSHDEIVKKSEEPYYSLGGLMHYFSTIQEVASQVIFGTEIVEKESCEEIFTKVIT